jgi:hypothetical protein
LNDFGLGKKKVKEKNKKIPVGKLKFFVKWYIVQHRDFADSKAWPEERKKRMPQAERCWVEKIEVRLVQTDYRRSNWTDEHKLRGASAARVVNKLI